MTSRCHAGRLEHDQVCPELDPELHPERALSVALSGTARLCGVNSSLLAFTYVPGLFALGIVLIVVVIMVAFKSMRGGGRRGGRRR
jgi:hypothetical protein